MSLRLCLLDKLKNLPELKQVHLERSLTRVLYQLIEALPTKECLIINLLNSSVDSLIKEFNKKSKKSITFTPKFYQTNNLIILINRLTSYNNISPLKKDVTMLFKILLQELKSKEQLSNKYWTDVYLELSNKLWSPTIVNCQNLPLTTSSNLIYKKSLINEDTPNTSNYIDKWINKNIQQEVIPTMKTLSLKLKLTPSQKQVIDRDLFTSKKIYNKAVNILNDPYIKKKTKLDLRDTLVTYETRKSENNSLYQLVDKFKRKLELVYREFKVKTLADWIKKYIIMRNKWLRPIKKIHKIIKNDSETVINEMIEDYELATHKDIRAGACFEAFTNYKTNINKIKSGQIKYFTLKHRSKKKNQLTMRITKSMLKIIDGEIYFKSRQMDDKKIKLSKKSQKKLSMFIKSKDDLKDSNISKKFNNYYLNLTVNNTIYPQQVLERVIGIDPGIRTFLTGYSTDHTIEFNQSKKDIDKTDKLREVLKRLRKKRNRKRVRKRTLNKLDLRKERLINELHWKSINYLVKNYDLIFLEKFDSQGFVKNGNNKTLNRDTNNLKPYQFRQRLTYKSLINGVRLSLVAPHHTTKTCSGCGNHQDIEASKIYDCSSCKNVYDRDINSAKNILMKGLLA